MYRGYIGLTGIRLGEWSVWGEIEIILCKGRLKKLVLIGLGDEWGVRGSVVIFYIYYRGYLGREIRFIKSINFGV